MLRYGLGWGISDTHGIKLVCQQVVDDIAPRVISTVDLFDTELVMCAEQVGYRIVKLPASIKEFRETNSSLIKRVPRTLKGVWRIRQDMRLSKPSSIERWASTV